VRREALASLVSGRTRGVGSGETARLSTISMKTKTLRRKRQNCPKMHVIPSKDVISIRLAGAIDSLADLYDVYETTDTYARIEVSA